MGKSDLDQSELCKENLWWNLKLFPSILFIEKMESLFISCSAGATWSMSLKQEPGILVLGFACWRDMKVCLWPRHGRPPLCYGPTPPTESFHFTTCGSCEMPCEKNFGLVRAPEIADEMKTEGVSMAFVGIYYVLMEFIGLLSPPRLALKRNGPARITTLQQLRPAAHFKP